MVRQRRKAPANPCRTRAFLVQLFCNIFSIFFLTKLSKNGILFSTKGNKENGTMNNTMHEPREISLDNGLTFTSAHDAMPEILRLNLWDAIVNLMDDEVRERVHAFAPCDEEEFLIKYLELAEENLVLG